MKPNKVKEMRHSFAPSVWCVFIELTAKWPLPTETWNEMWREICGVGHESHLWRETVGISYSEACIVSINAASTSDAQRIVLDVARRAMRRAVVPARIVTISELKVVHNGRCGEMGDFPDLE